MLQATRVWAVLLLVLSVSFLQSQGQEGGTVPPPTPPDIPSCTDGDIRLSDGSTVREGRVEICLENRWGTVCDDDWDVNDAAVVCRQLGYSTDGARATIEAFPFGLGAGPIFLETVQCLGDEETLLNCSHNGIRNHDCVHTEDAGAACEEIGFSCEDGDVRLVGGNNQYEGRLEVCRNNRFGTACDDLTWNDADAQVACRNLGFEPEGAIAVGGGQYGLGLGAIHFAGLRCTGEEENFFNCTIRFTIFSFFCSHFDDVGVLCPRPNATCENGDVRLVNGRLPTEGRVEVCYNGHWGTVCHLGWDDREAAVVCGELGYERDGAISVGFGDFGRGEDLILLSDLECNGTESNLAQCPHGGIADHFCSHNQDAGVICPNPNSTCTDGEVRLSKGETPNEGLLEICYNNNFATVCSNDFDPVDTSVVCNQLGYDPSNSFPLASAFFGEGVGIVLLDGVECVGNESNLLNCSHLGFGVTNCLHDNDVSILCGTTNAVCNNGEIRLVNGTGNHSGRVEICFNDRWGTVCDDDWGAHDAEVVCRQLGFPTEGAIAMRAAAFGEGTGPIFLDNVDCAPENHSALIECFEPEEEVGVHDCRHAEDAGVICPIPSHECLNGDVRLVGGETDLEGRVELCIDGYWGTICDNFWSDLDAAAVCTQLEFGPTDAVAVRGALFGEGEGPIFLDQFICLGGEEHILDCLHTRASYDICRHSEDAGVICKLKSCDDNDLRLVGGELESEGRVEICRDNQFGTICDDTFDTLDAMVICRHLGYSGEGAIPLPRAFFGAGSRRVLIDTLDCFGNETRIEDCPQDPDNRLCFHSEDASVLCQAEGANCTNGELRLVHGFHDCEGTVQVCFNGRWGSICDDRWDHTDAQIVCGLVGCETEGALSTVEAYFDVSDGPIFLDQVECTGTETNILQCPSDEPGLHNCIHSEDSGVICQVRDPNYECEHGDLRLVDGGRPFEGRVEVCINGNWGTVCDDAWDDDDASVVCHQLGFGRERATAIRNARFGEGEGEIYITQSRCNGSENQLIDCNGMGPGTFCIHPYDAGVICREPICLSGEVRLTGGETQNEGTVELCVGNRWEGSICDEGWDNADAVVVCRQLGLTGEVTAVAVRGSFFGDGPGEILRTQLGCIGNESDISECSFDTPDSFCTHDDDVGVICPAEETNCTTGDIRLEGGTSEYLGRVEVCLHGRWGTVCDDGWDSRDATVVCNQLGFTENGFPVPLHLSAFGFGSGLIFLDEVQCEGTEASLLGCRTHEIGTHNCFHSEDASVICPDPDSACMNGALRLRREGGNSTYQGTVEICMAGSWGSVCADRFWGDADASVVCSQLGHSPEGAIALDNAAFGRGEGLILLRRVRCAGNETVLAHCPVVEPTSFFFDFSCTTHASDAGVICRDPTFSCNDGDLRLQNGETEFEGRVEICRDNHFGTICELGWDGDDAAVACRQLGFPGENAVAVRGGYFGTGIGRIHIGGVGCVGSEGALTDCQHFRDPSPLACDHSLDAGVICQVPNPDCSHGDVRLVGGSTELEGRVDLCVGGRWGSVCDDAWDDTDASVVCGQLGFLRNNSLATDTAFFGRGTGPIFIDQTECLGNESSLLDCFHSGAGVHDCSHFEDAGAICTATTCENGAVRLVNGFSEYSGRVELCAGGLWGTVCDDNFMSEQANNVCQKQGFRATGAIPTSSAFFGEGEGLMYDSDGTAASEQCSHRNDAGVFCQPLTADPASVCETGAVRLRGGNSDNEGRVEVCLNNQWGTVCDDSWDDRSAAIVCNQLNLPTGVITAVQNAAFGRGTGPVFLDDIKCRGNETNILSCPQLPKDSTHNCRHSEDAGVLCQELVEPTCLTGDVRLTGGETQNEGTVELCVGNEWGSICDEGWDNADAAVVCQQLGLTGEVTAVAVRGSFFGDGPGEVLRTQLGCIGNESDISECSFDTPDRFCTHDDDVGVICPVTLLANCAGVLGELSCGDAADGTCYTASYAVQQDNSVTFTVSARTPGNTWVGLGVSDDQRMSNTDIVLGAADGTNSFIHDRYAFAQAQPPVDGSQDIVRASAEHVDGVTTITFNRPRNSGDANDISLNECRFFLFAFRGQVNFFATPPVAIYHGFGPTRRAASAQRICIPTFTECPGAVQANCTTGDIRLEGGRSENLGRVEVCLHGRWGTVCDDGWDSRDATVVCNQLGFTENGFPVPLHLSAYGFGTGLIFLDEVQCEGTEVSLLGCRTHEIGTHNCFHSEDASVICPVPDSACPNGAIRLRREEGDSSYQGTVEICMAGNWGSVCADRFWGDADASVVCSQLGHSPEGAIALDNAEFGPGEGLILLRRVHCAGNETVLAHCPVVEPTSFFFDFSCQTHASDAGVICRDPNFSCIDGELRLQDGETEFEGRVEICRNNDFGTICELGWDENDAAVACRQLGFPGENAIAVRGGYFGTGIGRIHIANVRCVRSEGTLMDCPHLRNPSPLACDHSLDAGVICQVPDPDCSHGDVRLVGGSTEQEGRVELCIGGRWGSVCDDAWDDTDASVVCRQLGYSRNNSLATDTAFFGRGTGPIFIDQTDCFGNESRLLDCLHSGAGVHDCSHFEDAGAICTVTTCQNGAVRLVNGFSEYSGRVELCAGGLWGTVCDDNFISEQANNVCQKQGFRATGAIPTSSAFFGEGEGLMYNSDGTAASEQCSHMNDAGVFCQPLTADPASVCETGAVRLRGGNSDNEGRVEVCLNNQWGTVCDDSWDDRSAAIVCNQLNLPTGVITAVVNAGFGKGTGPVFLDDIKCRGNETNILSCPQLPKDTTHNCRHSEDAGVQCQATPQVCTQGAMRLVDGYSDSNGRFEICVNEKWGTVCDDKFGREEADATCGALGFKNSDAIPTKNAFFGEGKGLIYNSDGSVASQQCRHRNDAGVFCQPLNPDRFTCETGAVRLRGGSTSSEGRVEVCLNSRWGTVCDSFWDDTNAAVVCNQLDLPSGDATAVLMGRFGQGPGPIHLDSVQCRGNENNILSCPQLAKNAPRNCDDSQNAGVQCRDESPTARVDDTKKSTNTAAIVAPIIVIVIIIIVVVIVVIVFVLYRRQRAGKYPLRHGDEIPITRTESFTSRADSEAPEKSDLSQDTPESPL